MMPSPQIVEECLPHRSTMALLHEMVDWESDCVTAKVVISEDVPFYLDGAVPAYIGLEYMAQACAAWSGCRDLENGASPRVGFLLGTRDFFATCDCYNRGDELTVMAKLEYEGEGIARFDCLIKRNDETIVSAHISVYQPNRKFSVQQDRDD